MSEPSNTDRWSAEKANAWYAAQPWLVGCNFIPSNAINQLEMWQAGTFDPATIDRELGWAEEIGFNTLRVYLHSLAYAADAEGFLARVDRFLDLAKAHGMRPVLVLFDDCWNPDPKTGLQPAPRPGVHNSGWWQDPGVRVVNDPSLWTGLDAYVQGVIGAFAQDPRVLLWDLYNEPGNNQQGARSLPLLKEAFAWARAASPSQPLSAGVWFDNDELNAFQLAASDVITFHNYNGPADLKSQIDDLRAYGRPLICTEWLRRGNSEVAECLPVFFQEQVGCINWGLVSGKTQTIFAWNTPTDGTEPALWFHDLFRQDGTPFSADEIATFRRYTSQRAV